MNCKNAIVSFEPIVGEGAQVLVLGTMPSEESLRKGQYYGNPQNKFWRIMFDLFEEEFSTSYEQRCELLKRHKIALWDVLRSCDRVGSLDTKIRRGSEMPNDIKSFLIANPTIRAIIFSSKRAKELYFRLINQSNNSMHYAYVAPSPSPANASMRYEEKLAHWKEIIVGLSL